jgi:hypothetical protein
MATLTETTKDKIRLALGYSVTNTGDIIDATRRLEDALSITFSTTIAATLEGWIAALATIDEGLLALLADSMAKSTKYVELDWVQQRNLYLQQGHTIVESIAGLLNVAIIRNKYPLASRSKSSW